jgi:hypothetical protein
LEAADLRAVKLWAVSIMENDCEVHGDGFVGRVRGVGGVVAGGRIAREGENGLEDVWEIAKQSKANSIL